MILGQILPIYLGFQYHISLCQSGFIHRSQAKERDGGELLQHEASSTSSGAVAHIRVKDKVSSNVLKIWSRTGTSPSRRYIDYLSNSDDDPNLPFRNFKDYVHHTKIQFGNQSFEVVVDTGSADTWVVSTDFNCTAISGVCGLGFGPGYRETSSFTLIPGTFIDLVYASWESMRGKLGYETVTLGKVSVKNQTIGVMHRGDWKGDGITSGLLGLALPNDTSAFYGPPANIDTDKFVYDPVFTSMHQQNLTKPYFSIALNRKDEEPGALALGGLPGPPIRYSENFVRAKFEQLVYEDGTPMKPAGIYNLYMISIDGFEVARQKVPQKLNAIIDTGSPFIYATKKLVTRFNQGWIPSATFDQNISQWTVDCNATPPDFGIVVNNQTLHVDKKGLIIEGGVGIIPSTGGSGKCLSAVQETGPLAFGVHIIGAPLLQSVLVVFDVGASELRFAQRIR